MYNKKIDKKHRTNYTKNTKNYRRHFAAYVSVDMMKESHHSTVGTSPSANSFFGNIDANLAADAIPVFLAAKLISF